MENDLVILIGNWNMQNKGVNKALERIEHLNKKQVFLMESMDFFI